MPALVAGFEAARRRGRPRLDARFLPLLAAGYLQYRLCGGYRQARGGGGPGMEAPPKRLVTEGPYSLSRNPMYLGHLVFTVGLALTFRSPLGLLLVGERWLRFSRRAARDEARLRLRFGAEYEAYCARVPRWFSWRPPGAPPSRSPGA